MCTEINESCLFLAPFKIEPQIKMYTWNHYGIKININVSEGNRTENIQQMTHVANVVGKKCIY